MGKFVKITLSILSVIMFAAVSAQPLDGPTVTWTSHSESLGDGEYEIVSIRRNALYIERACPQR